MYIKSPWLSLLFKLCIFLFGAWIFADSTGFLSGKPDLRSFCYYTYLSNLLCLMFFLGAIILQAVRMPIYAPFLPRFKGAVVISILLTMAVYHFLLDGYRGSLASKTLHYYIPLLTFFDWLLFDKKGVIRPQDPLWWTAIPFAYLVFILLRAKYGRPFLHSGRYPYPFLNVTALGWAAVGRTCLIILVAFISAGYLVYLLDRTLGKAADKKKEKPSQDQTSTSSVG